MRKEIERRLIDFAVLVFETCKSMDDGLVSSCLMNQIIRSGTSAALNYGEAQSAESKKDFVHKTSIVLKELRETHINLQIISQAGLCNDQEKIIQAIGESDQLVAIFHKTVITARTNS